ncbi:hypothetical protein OKW50_004065 [Paraburkholderia youngii]|uniref:hypothetical protein n=1 Tax=Paraburkholderia youngii TaxID=2782701 RepID=UPI003D25034F
MHHHASLRAMLPLLAFTGLFVLVYAGEPVKYGFLLIYMEEHLKLSPAVRGAVIAAALGVFANLCFALWPSATGMFAGQVLMTARTETRRQA